MTNLQLTVWRNASKPALQAVCNSLAGLEPANTKLSHLADDTFGRLLQEIDKSIGLAWEAEHNAE